MLRIFFAIALTATATLFSATSCRKADLEDALENLKALRAQADAEQSIAVLLEIVQEQLTQNPVLNSGLNVPASTSTCPVVTTSNGGFPVTLTLDFGTGCTTSKGYQMSGVIHGTVSGKTDDSGALVNLRLDNLSINGNKVSGSIALKTTGKSGTAQQSLSFTLAAFKMDNTEGQHLEISQLTGTLTQTEGQTTTPKTGGGTLALKDDVFEIAFEGMGTDPEGKAFSLKTTRPLRREYGCEYIVSGIITYDVEPIAKSADYGNGTCDNKLTVSAGGISKEVVMP